MSFPLVRASRKPIFLHSRKKFGAVRNASTFSLDSHLNTAYVAVGSNMGDRYCNVLDGLSLLTSGDDVSVHDTSFLYETDPMYVTDQPAFLNGVVEVRTTLSPMELLQKLKEVEGRLGRKKPNDNDVVRYGPRPLDLDILLYGREEDEDAGGSIVLSIAESNKNPLFLEIPHPRMLERGFVMQPLCDLNASIIHPIFQRPASELMRGLTKGVRVLPLPRGRMLQLDRVIVMGILNVTPDSFSDGGNHQGSVELATDAALKMIEDGATIIDIGGESTRPGAAEVKVEEELQRTLPVIRSLRKMTDVVISIDTRHAMVAKMAVEAGADIVNDVSGGRFDPNMLSTVSSLRVPMVLMHSRGTPETMQNFTHYGDDTDVAVVEGVFNEWTVLSQEASSAGIYRWAQVLDPGIGFAKDMRGNLSLIKHLSDLRQRTRGIPILLGPSRKGFLEQAIASMSSHLHRPTKPNERDFGTAAACVAGLYADSSEGCSIVRVHDVRGIHQAMAVMEAIARAS